MIILEHFLSNHVLCQILRHLQKHFILIDFFFNWVRSKGRSTVLNNHLAPKFDVDP